MKTEFCETENYRIVTNNRKISGNDSIDFVRSCIVGYCRLRDNSGGGSLHVVVDDGNYSDDTLMYALNFCIRESDFQGVLLLNLIMLIPSDQRFRLDNIDLYP